MTTIKVNAGKPYDVKIGAGILCSVGKDIRALMGGLRAAVITDSNVAPLYLDGVLKNLEAAGYETDSFVFKAGEESKNADNLVEILEFLAMMGYTRTDVVISLGGGVVGDITGFAAAVYLRGIDFVQIPTTLLAAVDSSVGGKTAIDLKAGKNLAGAFKQPRLVIMDTDTLKTLPEFELSNGMAEAIKYGVLFDEELFESFADEISDEMLESVIAKCVQHKANIVERDEFDRGERKLLNLGHTIGHAVEKASGYTVAHGHAVAAGMAMIARSCENLGIAEKGTTERIEKMLEKYNLPTNYDCDPARLAGLALSDKKREGATISLILPEKIGKCIIKDEPVAELKRYISAGM